MRPHLIKLITVLGLLTTSRAGLPPGRCWVFQVRNVRDMTYYDLYGPIQNEKVDGFVPPSNGVGEAGFQRQNGARYVDNRHIKPVGQGKGGGFLVLVADILMHPGNNSWTSLSHGCQKNQRCHPINMQWRHGFRPENNKLREVLEKTFEKRRCINTKLAINKSYEIGNPSAGNAVFGLVPGFDYVKNEFILKIGDTAKLGKNEVKVLKIDNAQGEIPYATVSDHKKPVRISELEPLKPTEFTIPNLDQAAKGASQDNGQYGCWVGINQILLGQQIAEIRKRYSLNLIQEINKTFVYEIRDTSKGDRLVVIIRSDQAVGKLGMLRNPMNPAAPSPLNHFEFGCPSVPSDGTQSSISKDFELDIAFPSVPTTGRSEQKLDESKSLHDSEDDLEARLAKLMGL